MNNVRILEGETIECPHCNKVIAIAKYSGSTPDCINYEQSADKFCKKLTLSLIESRHAYIAGNELFKMKLK